MLSEEEATKVMFFISCHEPDNCVVKHLYELHKLRDNEINTRLCHLALEFEDIEICYKLGDMYYGS